MTIYIYGILSNVRGRLSTEDLVHWHYNNRGRSYLNTADRVSLIYEQRKETKDEEGGYIDGATWLLVDVYPLLVIRIAFYYYMTAVLVYMIDGRYPQRRDGRDGRGQEGGGIKGSQLLDSTSPPFAKWHDM